MIVKRTVEVTQADIDEGKPGQAGGCPVARATLRTFPEVLWVGVTMHSILLEVSYTRYYRVKGLSAVADFVPRFDNKLTRSQAAPFSFELEVDFSKAWAEGHEPERWT